mgnify:CR=1 FL=1
MNKKKTKGLGKGLSALFGDQKKPEKSIEIQGSVQKALIGELARNKYQPRTIFDEDKLEELSKSIQKNGIIQPIAVRKNKSSDEPYEIVAAQAEKNEIVIPLSAPSKKPVAVIAKLSAISTFFDNPKMKIVRPTSIFDFNMLALIFPICGNSSLCLTIGPAIS